MNIGQFIKYAAVLGLFKKSEDTGGGGGTPQPGEVTAKYGVALIGDSIGQGGGVTKTSLLERICMFSNQMWVFRRYFAVGGKKSAEIRAEQFSQVKTMSPLPKTLIIECGYNDLDNPAAALVEIEAMYVESLELGIVPVATLIHPRTETPSSVAAAYQINNGVAKLKDKYGLPLMDMAGIFWAPQGYAFKDTTFTNDGTHLMVRSYSYAAKEILKDPRFIEMAPKDGGIQMLYSNEDHANWAVNGLFMLPGPYNGAGYWERSNDGANLERPDAVSGRGRALKATRSETASIFGGTTLDIEVNSGGRMEITAIIESEWGPTAETFINNIAPGSTTAEQYAAANNRDDAIPFVDLLNVYFTSSDYTQNYGTQFALGKPGSRHERSTIKVQMDVPVGATRGIFIFGSMNSRAVANETWCSIEMLMVQRLW